MIRVIRESDEPKLELKIRFRLSDIQVEDILEIRLRQLARLEGFKIEKELAELQAEREGLNHLLGNEGARRKLLVKEIRQDIKLYGDERRTLIEASEKITAGRVEVVADEPVTILLSKNGFIRSRSGHGVDRSAINWKAGDSELVVLETRSVHPVVLLDDTGRTYTLRSVDLPGGKGDGVPVTSLVELQGQRVVSLISAPPETRYLMASSAGVGFIAKLVDMTSRQRAGKAFMNLDEGAKLLIPEKLCDGQQWVAALSSEPRLLVFPIEEFKELSGGKGVLLNSMVPGETLVAAIPMNDKLTVVGEGRGGKPQEWNVKPLDLAECRAHRAKKGKLLPVKFKVAGLLVVD